MSEAKPTLDDAVNVIDAELDKYRDALELLFNAPPDVLRILSNERHADLLTAQVRLGKLTILADAIHKAEQP